MLRQLTISSTAKIDPLKLIDSRMLINANSGGGKSYLIRVLAEQAAGQIQTIILDHEGEFATLREKFDFILAGPGGEIPVEVRAATLMARKLLELQASSVVDMSSLKLPERRRFVKLFIESLMAAPKNLWHPLLVVLDEAHIYCPERSAGDAESTQAVIDLMSMGRKRSFCGVLATQRLSKLHKDAEAEANNVFIGRTWLDIDQKRAGGLLGFGKEKYPEMRDMPRGCFFCFGPALSTSGVEMVKINESQTTHPRPGHRHNFTPPKPTEAVRRLMKDLADLPQQADTEIRDLADAKKKIISLEQELKKSKVPVAAAPPVNFKEEKKASYDQGRVDGKKDAVKEIAKKVTEIRKSNSKLQEIISDASKQVAHNGAVLIELKTGDFDVPEPLSLNTGHVLPNRAGDFVVTKFKTAESGRFSSKEPPMSQPLAEGETLPPGERSVLIVMAQFDGASAEQLTVMTGYKRSSRNSYLQRLRARGFIMESGGKYVATEAGFQALGDYEKLPTGSDLQEYWLRKLPEGEAKVLKVLLQHYPDPVSNETIDEATGYKRSSRNSYIQRMRAKNLFTEGDGGITASSNLFD